MAISEQARHDLHTKLEAVLGREEAATLMEHLPPTSWADVATKHDLMLVKRDLDAMRAQLTADFRAELNAAITSQTRTIMFTVIASQLTMAALSLLR